MHCGKHRSHLASCCTAKDTLNDGELVMGCPKLEHSALQSSTLSLHILIFSEDEVIRQLEWLALECLIQMPLNTGYCPLAHILMRLMGCIYA